MSTGIFISRQANIFTKQTRTLTVLLLITELTVILQFIMIQLVHCSTDQMAVTVFQYLTQTVISSDTLLKKISVLDGFIGRL